MFGTPTAIDLARAQFAFTVSFHFIFPAFTIGLASYLMVLEALWLKTGRDVFLQLFRYWLKIFAITFGMGVVSGIVMAYQFGSNWAVFSDRAGPVIGPLMAYEVLTAFFLEAGFLGVMLFGLERVGKGLHFGATCMVALGTAVSTFWIISANSWMHTPVGYSVNAQGQYVPSGGWLAVIFSPSMPYRLAHVLLAAYLTTALVVGGAGAWHLLKARRENRAPTEGTRIMFSMAMWMAAIVAPIQIFAGDEHGLNTQRYQPAKIAAMEGDFRTAPGGSPLILFGLPDDKAQTMRAEVAIPKLGSVILKHDPNVPVTGLDKFAAENRPPVAILFWSFRLMVGIGFAMLGLGLWSLAGRLTGRLYDWPWLHRLALVMGPSGFVAVIAGWVTTEVGRQPYTIYGLLRTAQSVSPLAAPAVAASLMAFVIVYFAVFGAGIWFILRRMDHEPHPGEPGLGSDELTRTAGLTPAQQGGPEQGLVPAE